MSEPIELFENASPKSQKNLWIVVAGLAVLLVVLNFWPGEDEADSKPSPVAAATPTPADKPAIKPVTRKIVWPEIALEDVLQADPFHAGQEAALAQAQALASGQPANTMEALLGSPGGLPKPTDLEMAELDIEKYPVKLVFQSPRGSAALIGDQVYYQGDVIEGMRIVQIASQGVTLQPVASSRN